MCFGKQKTAYGMRMSDWSSDVCSSDLIEGGKADQDRQRGKADRGDGAEHQRQQRAEVAQCAAQLTQIENKFLALQRCHSAPHLCCFGRQENMAGRDPRYGISCITGYRPRHRGQNRSEEHTSELQSLMRISYA